MDVKPEQTRNVSLPIRFMLDESVTEVNPEQESNILFAMPLTPVKSKAPETFPRLTTQPDTSDTPGMVVVSKRSLEHPEKAPAPMLVKLFGIETDFKFEQS